MSLLPSGTPERVIKVFLLTGALTGCEQDGGHKNARSSALQPGYDSSRRRQSAVGDDITQLVLCPAGRPCRRSGTS